MVASFRIALVAFIFQFNSRDYNHTIEMLTFNDE
jgi:hypothetical protein